MTALNNNNNSRVTDSNKISFTFDGKKYFGFDGDTVASAFKK